MNLGNERVTRRAVLARSVQAAAFAAATTHLQPLFAAPASRWFKIGGCDWSLGKRSDPAAFELARQIGLDGVQIDMGTIENDMHVRQPAVQQAYREATQRTGVAIASLAEAAFWQAPLSTDPRAEKWLAESIDICKALGLKVTMPACFEVDLNDAARTARFVKVIQTVAPQAERAGITIGLENWLSAEDHLRLLDRIGSPAVKVYYDVGNSTDKGRDILQEIRTLGKRQLICELHAKDARAMLGQGRIDFRQVRKALDEIDYSGWIQIEAAAPHGVVPDFTANYKYLKAIFPQNG